MSDSEDSLPRKRKTRSSKKNSKFDKSYFFDDYAESGDEEESEVDSEFEGEYQEAMKMQRELPKRKPMYENLTAEEIAETFEKKVAYQKESFISKEISVVSKQQELPSISDPKLWQVFCRPGKAREIAINLMCKAIESPNWMIFSVFASSFISDFLYVEAFSKHDVLVSIKGMTQINERKIVVVPISEMVDVFCMGISMKNKLKVGEFVRIGFGMYKDDLAQIVAMEEHIGKVTVRLIPRLDVGSNKKIRPPPKLFNPADYSCDKKRDGSTQEVYYSYLNNVFRNGFLYKTLAFRSLRTTDINPTLAEIKIFDDNKLPMVLKARQVSFVQGDKVIVVQGDSKGLTGSVESSDNLMVYMYPFIEELCDKKLEFPVTEISKYFDVGDHIKVAEGRYAGLTGMVVASKDKTIDVIADITRTLITVLANDSKLSEEVCSGQGKSEDYRVNDIVVLKSELKFGIITQVNPSGITVVLNNNETENVFFHEIQKKYTPQKFTVLDRDQNKLFYNDMVKIIFSKHDLNGKFGSVKNGFRGMIFLNVHDYLDTITVCVKASYCVIQGKVQEKDVNTHDFKGSIVRIKSGAYRGYTGKVIEYGESRLKVELSTMSKVITIDAAVCEKIEANYDVMNLQEIRKTPAVHSPAYTPHADASPWDIKDTPSYYKKY